MKFDLFYELSNPPFAERPETEVYAAALEEIKLGEHLGFATAWLVEHHFMRGYSHSSAPELFLAALSQQTQSIRLGHAIVPMPYNHPIRVAERLATLDVLSQGRLEFGFGRGFNPKEYAVFGVEMSASRSYTEESLQVILESFKRQALSFQGEHFQFNDLDLTPHPVQNPHPPIWTAAVSPDSFEMAAQQGIGVLVGPFKPWFMVKEDIRNYRKAWQQHQGDSDKPGLNPKVAMTVGIYCHEDAEIARTEAKQALEWFYTQLLGQTRPILEKLYDSYEYYRNMGRFRALLGAGINLSVLDTFGMAIVGDPEHCVKKLQTLRDEGVDHVLCAFGAGAMPSQAVQDSMQLFAEQVMPHFD